MLPDFRFLIGAVLATAVLGVTTFGLATAVQLSHQTKIGPLEVARSFAFAEPAVRRPFDDAASRGGFETAGQSEGAVFIEDSAAVAVTMVSLMPQSSPPERPAPAAAALAPAPAERAAAPIAALAPASAEPAAALAPSPPARAAAEAPKTVAAEVLTLPPADPATGPSVPAQSATDAPLEIATLAPAALVEPVPPPAAVAPTPAAARPTLREPAPSPAPAAAPAKAEAGKAKDAKSAIKSATKSVPKAATKGASKTAAKGKAGKGKALAKAKTARRRTKVSRQPIAQTGYPVAAQGKKTSPQKTSQQFFDRTFNHEFRNSAAARSPE
jgi:hypothetical protein